MGSVVQRFFFLMLVAVMSAVVLASGCKHKNLGPLDPIEVPGVPTGGDGIDKRVMTASVLTVGFHYLEIKFSSYMDDESVNWQVTDESGSEVTGILESWSPDVTVLRMRGPFAYCRTYTLTIFAGASDVSGIVLMSNIELTATIGRNPYDADQSGSCAADVVTSPFTEGFDAALLAGDFVSAAGGIWEKTLSDIDTGDSFYFDGSAYDYADATVRIPKESGAAALAKLVAADQLGGNGEIVATNYTLKIWDPVELGSDTPTSSIYQTVGVVTGITLHGPVAADLNGDGLTDLLVSAETPYADGSVLQKVYFLPAPFPTGGSLLINYNSMTLGGAGHALTHPTAVGDFDGDGKDDFAMIHNRVSASGQPYDWGVWIVKGGEISGNPTIEELGGSASRIIVDLAAGDFNGDGKSDLLVAELERKFALGGYHSLRPHVNVFFGGEAFEGRLTLAPDSDLYFTTNWDTFLNVAGIGDFDGDARDEIAFYVEERDMRNRVILSKIYVFSGRVDWYERYYMISRNVKHASMEIDCLGMGHVYFKDVVNDPLAGDIDNDGYLDMMVATDDGVNNAAYWFLGGDGYRVHGWELYLDQADIIWVFK